MVALRKQQTIRTREPEALVDLRFRKLLPRADWEQLPTFLGIPLPGLLTPTSESFEHQDDQDRFRFDVKISLPIFGLLAHYRGWLKPLNEE